MKKLLTSCLILIFAQSYAQDVFQESLYSADLVMKNREKISLTDRQAEKIKNIHSQNAGEFSSLKWDLENANAKLKGMLAAERVDQRAVDKQMDLVLSLENQLKKKQLNTLVAIKNELTESQQSELNQLKKSSVTTVVSTNTTAAKGTSGIGPTIGSLNLNSSGSKGIVSVTTRGDGQPLYLVKQGGKEKKVLKIDNIDPEMIQSISVLKGEKAQGLYGEEGKAGVIIIILKNEADYQF